MRLGCRLLILPCGQTEWRAHGGLTDSRIDDQSAYEHGAERDKHWGVSGTGRCSGASSPEMGTAIWSRTKRILALYWSMEMTSVGWS